MCTVWLAAIDVDYGLPEGEETNKARKDDAEERYNKTNALVTLFCNTTFASNHYDFRWTDLSNEERTRYRYVLEYIVLETLTTEYYLPLELAKDSWAASHLLAVGIRNLGNKKKVKAMKTGNVSFFFFFC